MSTATAEPKANPTAGKVLIYKNNQWFAVPEDADDFPIAHKLYVTPKWAAQVMNERNLENRDEKPAYQVKLIDAMRNNQFYTTNQGIGFYKNGQLADGQNRLRAIVKSGVACRMFVVFGIDPAAKPAIDDGVKRTDIDIRRLMGDRNTPRRCVMIANTMIAMMRNGINYPNKFEKQDFYNRYMEAFKFTDEAFNSVKRRGISQMSILAALARAYYHCEHSRLLEFVKVLNDGMPNGNQDIAAIKLRNLLWDETSKKDGKSGSKKSTGYNREEVYRKAEKAIAHFVKGEYVDRLYEAREELFPLPDENKFFTRIEPMEDAGEATRISLVQATLRD